MGDTEPASKVRAPVQDRSTFNAPEHIPDRIPKEPKTISAAEPFLDR